MPVTGCNLQQGLGLRLLAQRVPKPPFRESSDLRSRSERLQSADSVEKQRVAVAESVDLNRAQAPFSSGFARLLRCRKDLG